MNIYTIGKLALKAQVGVETIRFYEKKGLIKQPKKDGSFRYYPEDEVTKIRFIKRAQELGFTLLEIKELLELRLRPLSKCSDVLSKSEKKITEIESKITDLKRMKKSLQKLSSCCDDKSIPLSSCPILDNF